MPPAQKRAYSKQARQNYLAARAAWYAAESYSLRDKAWDVAKHFGLGGPPSPATIASDEKEIKERFTAKERERLAGLLDPNEFPQWRETHFQLPNGKGGYQTPRHQHALFWVIVCLAQKWKLPDWVAEYFDLPADIDELVERNVLLTFILLVAPRMGKTELVLHTLIWLIVYNPNIRIIYAQGVGRTAVRMMGYIQYELEFNESLVAEFGPFRGDAYPWNKEEFTVATRRSTSKSPTFLPVGITTNIRSVDADIIIVDDPQDIRRVVSETVAESDYHHFTTELMTRREAHTPVFGIGSHLPVPWGDLWSMLEENQESLETEDSKVIIRKLPAHNDEICEGVHDGTEKCTLWPEVRSYGFLMAQKALLESSQPGMYDVVYQQQPKASQVSYFEIETVTGYYITPTEKDERGVYIDPEWEDRPGILDLERSWKEWPSCCGKIVAGMGFDPAASEKAKGSFSALVVRTACVRCGRRFIVDYWRRQQSPERHPATITGFVKAYRNEGLSRVRIENNAYQKSLARDKALARDARLLGFIVQEWRTDDRKWSPDLGIPVLARTMNTGHLSVPWRTKADQAYGKAYIDTYKRYPRKPDDVAMADWLAELEVQAALKDALVNVPTHGYDYDEMPEYLQESHTIDLSEVPWNTEDLIRVV